MRLVVDLNRRGATPGVPPGSDVPSKLNGEEALAYDPEPDESQRQQVLRAVASCPVQAIILELDPPADRGRCEPRATRGRLLFDEIVKQFRAQGRIAIVGAPWRARALREALRRRVSRERMTIVGDEPHEPYDRHRCPSRYSGLGAGRPRKLFRLRRGGRQLETRGGGRPDRINHVVSSPTARRSNTAGCSSPPAPARPWPNPEEGALQVSSRSARRRTPLVWLRHWARPRRALIVGSGFVGSEIAPVCRDLDLPVTVAERGRCRAGQVGG